MSHKQSDTSQKAARKTLLHLKKLLLDLDPNLSFALSDQNDNAVKKNMSRIVAELIQDQGDLETALKRSCARKNEFYKILTQTDQHMAELGELLVHELKSQLPKIK